VFSNVWGDYTHELNNFDAAAEKEYTAHQEKIIEEYAKKSKFLVSILSENELSALTHKLNLWKSKEDRIMSGEKQVALSETDFDADDFKLIKLLDKMYPVSLIDHSTIIEIDDHYFVFSKEDAKQLSAQDFDILSELSDKEHLENPVYVELDEKGRLVVD
jgi:hypothetical protein